MNLMAQSSKTTSAKKRVTVQDLSADEKQLTEKEMKRVKGGFVTEISFPKGIKMDDVDVKMIQGEVNSKAKG
jgi:bacteriocin-like protein